MPQKKMIVTLSQQKYNCLTLVLLSKQILILFTTLKATFKIVLTILYKLVAFHHNWESPLQEFSFIYFLVNKNL